MTNHDGDDALWDDDNECWNCGGEGRVNDCIDGCCVDQDDIYCEYCSKVCDVCSRREAAQPVHSEKAPATPNDVVNPTLNLAKRFAEYHEDDETFY